MRLSWTHAVWLWTFFPLAVLGVLALAYRWRDSHRPSHPSHSSHQSQTDN